MNNLFRREGGPYLASDLIGFAVAHTRAKWPQVPALGIVTFVDPAKVTAKDIPGWCYIRAGWSHVGYTSGGKMVFQQLPNRKIGRRSKPMPDAIPVPGSTPSLWDVAS